MKIAVVGLGYVGLANAMLLSKSHQVIAVDVDTEKVNMLNSGISPIQDKHINEYLNMHNKDSSLYNENLKGSFKATLNTKEAFENAEFVIIATSTNYDPENNYFDTSSIENVIENVKQINASSTVIIKSTIPLGYTKILKKKFNYKNIIFSPEFLREGKALYDNLNPSRIIVGEISDKAKIFADIMREGASKKDIKILYTGSQEAEAIKLFSNSYLAMRVSYFNELDTYAEVNDLNTRQIIEGVCSDPRIGDHYNNPSFGYGGYCLPKDTKQLKANFKSIKNSLISAIVESNKIRKDFIAESILDTDPKCVGIFRLIMKSNSDNYRDSAILGIISRLTNKGIKVIIYEPLMGEDKKHFLDIDFIENLDVFKKKSDLIIANRISDEILDVKNKIYSRDLFSKD